MVAMVEAVMVAAGAAAVVVAIANYKIQLKNLPILLYPKIPASVYSGFTCSQAYNS